MENKYMFIFDVLQKIFFKVIWLYSIRLSLISSIIGNLKFCYYFYVLNIKCKYIDVDFNIYIINLWLLCKIN